MERRFQPYFLFVSAALSLAIACSAASETDPGGSDNAGASGATAGRAGGTAGSKGQAGKPGSTASGGITGAAGSGAGAGGAAGSPTIAGAAGSAAAGATGAAGQGSAAGKSGAAGMGAAGSTGAGGQAGAVPIATGLHVLIDSDANNELDDQHAIAYLLLSADKWHIDGITTNRTDAGEDAEKHFLEAQRVDKLCASDKVVPVFLGPDPKFIEIKDKVNQADYPGHDSVEFIISQAKHHSPQNKLVLIAIGKITNVALALFKDKTIAANIRLVWLGSNWPSNTPEFNQWGDWGGLKYVLEESDVQFEIAVVRYGQSSGAEGVRVNRGDFINRVRGLGPKVPAVTGRHGGSFTTFGDYSANLFENIGSDSRSLYDVCAVAVVKNPAWAKFQDVGAPGLKIDNPTNPQAAGTFVSKPDNPRKVRFWENFSAGPIVDDFVNTLKNYKVQQP